MARLWKLGWSPCLNGPSLLLIYGIASVMGRMAIHALSHWSLLLPSWSFLWDNCAWWFLSSDQENMWCSKILAALNKMHWNPFSFVKKFHVFGCTFFNWLLRNTTKIGVHINYKLRTGNVHIRISVTVYYIIICAIRVVRSLNLRNSIS